MRQFKRFTEKNPWIWSAIGAAVLWLIMGSISKFSLTSLATIIYTVSYLALVSLGQMLVITSGRGAIDLSIPDVITLSAFLSMGLINGQNRNLPWVFLLVILLGVTVGFLNSRLVIYLKIPPIIATMGMGYILETVSLMYNHHFAVFETCSILTAISRTKLFGLQIVIYIILLLAVVVMFLLKRTTYGKALVAVGQNIEAAKLAGIDTVRVETLTYIFSSVLASVGGMLIAARVGGAFLGMGDSYQMESVGAVVLGGTLISGGKAVPVGTLAGCVFLGLIMSTMQIAGFPQGAQNVAKGILIIAVILIGEVNKRRQVSSAGTEANAAAKVQEVKDV